jgi:predicted Zn finger-like uncharacterized protein
MSLATRCTQCGTVFRVVQDQLKVSEGWVRCGRCNEVFNALEGLFDLEREAPPDWTPPAQRTGVLPMTPPQDAPDLGPAHDPGLVDRIDAEVFGRRLRERPSPPREPGERREPRGLVEDTEPPLAVPFDAPLAGPAADAAPAAGAPAVLPEFVRSAEQQAQWERSPRRAALAGTVLVLALLLALQWAHHFRDLVAARWPATAPLLAAWCDSLGCKLAPPRRIDAIAVESTALARAGAPDVFRLSVTLRNRETIALALPAIELSLTDGSGQLVARRVLAPADFRVAAPVIAAGAEQTMQLLLTAGSGRVSGYTVEIFYP